MPLNRKESVSRCGVSVKPFGRRRESGDRRTYDMLSDLLRTKRKGETVGSRSLLGFEALRRQCSRPFVTLGVCRCVITAHDYLLRMPERVQVCLSAGECERRRRSRLAV